MYLIYEGHLLLFTYDLLSLSIYSYYFILFFFYLLYISFIYFFLSLFFVSIYFSLYILFICFLYSLIFSFKDFLLCPPRKFYFCFLLLVYVYGYKFVLFASYKKRSSISEPLFSLFYFFEEFRCCSKIFCFSKFLISFFNSFFQCFSTRFKPFSSSFYSNYKTFLLIVPVDISYS